MNRTPDEKMLGELKSSLREIQSYLRQISGTLLDRIDLHVEVPQVKLCNYNDADFRDKSV